MLMPTTTYLPPRYTVQGLLSIYPIRRNEEPANRFTAWRDRGGQAVTLPPGLHQIFISNPATKKDMLVQQVMMMLMDVPAEVRLG